MAFFSFDPRSSGKKSGGDKPKLWTQGRQRPSFDMAAFLSASRANSCALAAPALSSIAGHLNGFGARVETGVVRIPADRLGRTGKWLPSHVTTGRRLRDTAALMGVAAETVRGSVPVAAVPAKVDTLPAPVMQTAPVLVPDLAVAAREDRPPMARPRRPAPLPAAPVDAAGERDTLEAIRSLMLTPIVEPVHPKRAPKAAPPPPGGIEALPELAPAERRPDHSLFTLAGRGLGLLSVGLAFPLGLVQTGYACARGDDLRLSP